MKSIEQINGEKVVEILPYQRIIKDIQEKLAQSVLEVKAQKESAPYLKDWVEIQVKMSGNNLVMKKEFCFAEIFRGIEEDLAKLIVLAEKNSKGAGVTINAYLYPYEFKGKKLLEEYRVKFLRGSEEAKEIKIEAILEERGILKKEEMEIKEKIVAVEEIKEIIAEATQEIVEVMEEVLPQEQAEVTWIVKPITANDNEAEGTVKIKPENKKVQRLSMKDEMLIMRKKEIKVLERTEDFYNDPIDFDFREWDVWPTNGTRNILKKVFILNQIVSPNDLKKFLNNENPSYEEWREFIDRLNVNCGKLRVGPSSESSLQDWMRKNKLIPIEFREKI